MLSDNVIGSLSIKMEDILNKNMDDEWQEWFNF